MRRILVVLTALAMILGMAPTAQAASLVPKLPPGCSQKYETQKTAKTIGTFFVTAQCTQHGMQPVKLSVVKVEVCAVGPIFGNCPKWLPWSVSSVKPGYRPTGQSVAANVNIRTMVGSWNYRLTMKGTYKINNHPPLIAQTIYFTNNRRQTFTFLV